jgi:mRNA interferase MazF
MTTGRRTTSPKRGSVVMVPYPFAELTSSKARPALVLSGERFFRSEGKIIVAAITSNVRAQRGVTNLLLVRWRESGLLKPSVVTSWLATLSPELILMRIGSLSDPDLQAVQSRIRAALEL